MIRQIADVIAVWKLYVEGDSEVAFVMVLHVGVVVAVPVVADI